MDHNSPETNVKEDPLVMYLVVRESINMSIGKTAAQCAHASQMLQIKYEKLHKALVHQRKLIQEGVSLLLPISTEMSQLETIFQQWMGIGIRKVVLQADEKEWVRIKEECPENVLVVDAGHTELAPGTETVIGIWPIKKSQAPKILRRLQVLK
jgi:peptidyl-tRNA hydrolase, PTH2 family